MASERKLDIFELLSAVDHHDLEYLSKQSEEARKEFAPVVALRWASSVRKEEYADYYLIMINEMANLNFFDIADHPILQYKLMAACGVGETLHHQWIPVVKRKSSGYLHQFLLQYWPNANDDELNILIQGFSKDEFKLFVEGTACDQQIAKKVISLHGQLKKS